MTSNALFPSRGLRLLGGAVIVLTLLVYAFSVVLGTLNQDEGWYLYAAQQVMQGNLPHRDFFFTQGSVMPLCYALFGNLWSPAGILGGRIFTAVLALLALVIVDRAVTRACVAHQASPLLARVVLWSCLGLNLWYTAFTSIPKTYALCTLGMAGAFWLLAPARSARPLTPWCAFLAGVLLATLVGVRSSMAVLPVVTLGWLFVRRGAVWRYAWLWLGMGTTLMLLVIFLPEILTCPEALLEAQAFHMARESMGLLGRLGCVARVLRFNPVLVLCGLLLFLTGFVHRTKAHRSGDCAELWLLCAGALFLVHLLAPVPYDDYQIPALLPMAMAIATGIASVSEPSFRRLLLPALPLLALLLTCAGSPIAQDWFVLGQDRFWVRWKAEPELLTLRHAGKQLRTWAREMGEETVWTQDLYLAVEAGLSVPKGLEMGPFSKPQPWNPEALPRLAAWSGYTFALHYPDLKPDVDAPQKLAELKRHYPHILAVYPDFGQGHTTLTIAKREETK